MEVPCKALAALQRLIGTQHAFIRVINVEFMKVDLLTCYITMHTVFCI